MSHFVVRSGRPELTLDKSPVYDTLKLRNSYFQTHAKENKGVVMDLIKVKRHYQLTLPADLRKKFKIAEGDYMRVEEKGEGILIKPVKVIDPDQEYFHTKEWQKGEAEADADIATGRVSGPFSSVKELIEGLES